MKTLKELSKYVKIMKGQGVNVIKYRNTSPTETEGVENTTSYVELKEVGGEPLKRTPEGVELGKSYAELQGKNPDEEVVVYRASEAGGKLKPGQFVTTSREIARFYARDIVGQRGASSAKVEKHRVKASEIRLKKSQQDIGVTDSFIYEPLARNIEGGFRGGPESSPQREKPR